MVVFPIPMAVACCVFPIWPITPLLSDVTFVEPCIFIIVESFILMMLALIGIIPSWFTLLVILFVAAALTRMVAGFLRGGQ